MCKNKDKVRVRISFVKLMDALKMEFNHLSSRLLKYWSVRFFLTNILQILLACEPHGLWSCARLSWRQAGTFSIGAGKRWRTDEAKLVRKGRDRDGRVFDKMMRLLELAREYVFLWANAKLLLANNIKVTFTHIKILRQPLIGESLIRLAINQSIQYGQIQPLVRHATPSFVLLCYYVGHLQQNHRQHLCAHSAPYRCIAVLQLFGG